MQRKRTNEDAPQKGHKDRSARTIEHRREWRTWLKTEFPDAIDIEIYDYGFKIRVPHPSNNVSYYTIIWRYNGIPDSLAGRHSLIDFLRETGETMGIITGLRYKHGQVNTYKT